MKAEILDESCCPSGVRISFLKTASAGQCEKHREYLGKPIGQKCKTQVRDAILRAAQAADIVGCRALLVHAKDPAAQAFYRKFGFESSPVNELHLYLLMKDILANQAATPAQG